MSKGCQLYVRLGAHNLIICTSDLSATSTTRVSIANVAGVNSRYLSDARQFGARRNSSGPLAI